MLSGNGRFYSFATKTNGFRAYHCDSGLVFVLGLTFGAFFACSFLRFSENRKLILAFFGNERASFCSFCTKMNTF